MKSLQQLILAATFAALACTGLHAQIIDMRATIPFDFYAGGRLMPAGEYVIHERSSLVMFDRTDGKAAGAFTTIGTEGKGPAQDSRLEFNRYGSEYFLMAVWNSVTADGRQTLPTAREKELAKRGDTPVPIVLVLTSRK